MKPDRLPHDPNVECAVLGGLIQSPEARESLLGPSGPQIVPDHFFSERNRIVFRKIAQLQAEKSPIDLVVVIAALERDGALVKAGGAAYVSSLVDGVPEPTAATALTYLQILDDLCRTRLVNKLSYELHTISRNGSMDWAAAFRIGEQIVEAAKDRGTSIDWRPSFTKIDALEENGPVKFVIKDFFPEGMSFIGALSGTGKTWLSLSVTKALTTGCNFLGLSRFEVSERIPVVYLVPEMGTRSFGYRARLMGICGTDFYFHTRDNGPPLVLNDPILLACAQDIRPVFILDTAIRFIKADENNASEISAELAKGCYSLLHAGARGIIANHHSPKASAKQPMTLENVLRGTGDFGAMADAVYGLRCSDPESLEITVQCVKSRDFEGPKAFVIQGRPWIDEDSDFRVLTEPGKTKEQIVVERVGAFIESRRDATYREISEACGVAEGRVKRLAAKAGWVKETGSWMWGK